MSVIRVVIADDHTLVRAGLRALLDGLEDAQVVAETGDGRDALRLVVELRPDIVLLDIGLPGMNGLEVLPRIRESCPGTRAIVLSMHDSREYVARALQAGAAGYLLKEATAAELGLAVRAVARGETFLSPVISQAVIDEYVKQVGDSPAPLLTPRQREILQLIAEGHSTKEIAHTLGVSVKTVETHRSQLMERLSIRDVAGLVRYAVRTGLIEP